MAEPFRLDATPWRPFPVAILPKRLREIVVSGAEATGVDPTFMLLPALAVAATAIGNSRRIASNQSWESPVTIWAATIGAAGTRKTPAFKLVMRPLEAHQDELDAAHVSDDENAPRAICYVTDITIERLAGVLQENPRGVGMLRDELSSWFQSLTKYRREGSDAAQWLELFNDGRFRVHRKTGTPRYVSVRGGNVSVCGSVQPEVLERCLANGNTENGLAGRFLLAWPPRILRQDFPSGVDEQTQSRWAVCIRRLLQAEMQPDGCGGTVPVVLSLTPDASAIWQAFYADHQTRQFEATGAYAAALSKLEGYVLRLALIYHLMEQADDVLGDDTAPVSAEAMRQAVTTVEWFIYETGRIYGRWARGDELTDALRAFDWLDARGGRGTLRDMLRCHLFDDAEQAERALADLAGEGLLMIETTRHPGAGRPGTEYVIRADNATQFG